MSIHGYVGNIITANPTAPTSTVASGVWTTEQQLAAVSAGNWPGYEYPVTQSLRFNSADSAYLNRTPAANGNRQIWTISFWLKRTTLATNGSLFGAGTNGSNYFLFYMTSGDVIRCEEVVSGANTWNIVTTPVYRDPSSWYHIVMAFDSPQATSSNRIKLYVNGIQVTAFSTATYPTQNLNSSYWNATSSHNIGAAIAAGVAYGNGYMTEINFVDGQALEPSSFGLNDPETGVWSPKRYTGTYGTNGFYLNFSDNSGTTSTTLGKDYSGNGNNWTPNNFSVTAGVGNDSLVDSPTAYGTDTGVGGEVRGNYATLNPLYKGYGGYTATSVTLSNGNLDQTGTTTGNNCIATQAITGKIYFEMTVSASSGGSFFPGIINESGSPRYYDNSGTYYNGSSSSSYGASFTTNDIIGVAVDNDALSITFYKNGVSQGTKTSAFPAGTWFPFFYTSNTQAIVANFGQRAFAYTAPSGFKALCTTNLPTPTIGATSTTLAGKYFNAITYTGDGTASRSITGVGFQPDFVWIKNRTVANFHQLHDAVRGATVGMLASNSTNAEDSAYPLTSFNADGYTTKSGAQDGTNNSGSAIVAWNWNAGGSNATNTSGTITSTVRANTTAGFSIITYTGTGSNATVGHGLGVAPSMIIIKRTNSTNSWQVYHSNANASPASGGLFLNTTDAFTALSTTWNSTVPASTVFSIGTAAGTNASGGTYVAYCFAPVAGYSAFGSYTGNGSTDGPFVYLGFRPRYIMQKRTDSTGTWELYDTARDTYNVMSADLAANLSDAETTLARFDSLSNGFKIRTTGAATNASGGTYIYACFAESPFKYALAR